MYNLLKFIIILGIKIYKNKQNHQLQLYFKEDLYLKLNEFLRQKDIL